MIQKIIRKTFTIRESGRSSDFISPSFGHGCLYKCAYCYMRRYKPKGLNIAKNIGDILTSINTHATMQLMAPVFKKPNQTDEKFITYDISCNEDFALHSKYYDWERIFQFFKEHPIAKATLATKWIPDEFLKFNPERKVRIRFSLMPKDYNKILEPNTSSIIDRIKAINKFIEAGYDVHINFSPVIWHLEDSKDKYKELFEWLNEYVKDEYKRNVKAEVIFLTHNKRMHEYNLKHDAVAEKLLWTPLLQEEKISQYGGKNIRYNYKLKNKFINEFKKLHNAIIPWNKIRYIF